MTLVIISIDLEVPMPCKWLFLEDKRAFRKCLENVSRWHASLLGLLSSMGIKATFFTEGFLTHWMPDIVADAADQGHEIACHSFSHYPPDLAAARKS